ncbi:MAG: hypothetical protein AB8B44_03535, partial [Prochlorococcus sp.]
MSPGNQMRAVTASKATPNKARIRAGNTVERKKFKGYQNFRSFCRSNHEYVDHAKLPRLRSHLRVK